jgi:guanine deaminase
MRRAIALSLQSVRDGGGPFGAVIVRDGIIIAEGTNRVTGTNDPTAHAEIVAIREACAKLGRFQLSDCDIYTSCEPCPMCLGGIYWGRLRSVFYGNSRDDAARAGFDDSLIYDQLELLPADRSIPMRQIIPAEALAGFRAWEGFEGKIRY